jgi:hypothetical protein
LAKSTPARRIGSKRALIGEGTPRGTKEYALAARA